MEAIGSVGVALLLGAFIATQCGALSTSSRIYQSMNALGAGIAGYASWGIGFMPFVILEAIWCAVALVSLFRARPSIQ